MATRPEANGSIGRKEFVSFTQDVRTQFEQVKGQFEQVDKRFDQMMQELRDQRHWVEVIVGRFQRRAGRNLEEMVAGCLRVALDMPDIRKEGIKLRQKFVDDAGEVGPPGRTYEIDLYATNDKSFLFEIKSYAELEDVQRFVDKALAASKKWGLKDPQLVLVGLEKGMQMQETCLRLGVTLV